MSNPTSAHDSNALRRLISLCVGCIVLTACTSTELLPSIQSISDSADIDPYSYGLFKTDTSAAKTIDVTSVASREVRPLKTDAIWILVDDSNDMDEEYMGVEIAEYAEVLRRRMVATLSSTNLTVRQIGFNGSRLRDIGTGQKLSTASSPDNVVEAATVLSQLAATESARTSLVVLTTWANTSDIPQSSLSSIRTNNENLCVYAVGVGDNMGRSQFDQYDLCGFSVAADDIARAEYMTHFLRRIVYAEPLDTDGDGIYDYKDECPQTAPGRTVSYNGCLLFEDNSTAEAM